MIEKECTGVYRRKLITCSLMKWNDCISSAGLQFAAHARSVFICCMNGHGKLRPDVVGCPL